jgi:hypothetical protein
MSKGQGGTFRGHNAKTGPSQQIPGEKRKPAAPPAPRMGPRPKASAKGR